MSSRAETREDAAHLGEPSIPRPSLALRAGDTQPATLIGWSLGGLCAREIGKLMAPRMRQAITMGTPFNAKADPTKVGWNQDVLAAVADRLRQKPGPWRRYVRAQ